jgi:hypothetical protein
MSVVIEYTSAGAVARIYETIKSKLEQAEQLLKEATEALDSGEFSFLSGSRGFVISTKYSPSDYEVAQEAIDQVKVAAWKSVVEKTGIQKFMSSTKRQELSDLLNGNVASAAKELPPLTEEQVTATVQGFAMCVDEFLQETVEEEYDYWKSVSQWDQKKTNQKMRSSGKLERKIIKSYAVHAEWRLRTQQSTERHLSTLESIMHLLDGKGMPKGYHSPTVDAINNGSWEGQTEYFEFKCCKNGNLHLTFRRLDLLEKFNGIAGRNRLAGN